MIVITGAAGFIGSNLVSKLNSGPVKELVLVDKFQDPQKNKNLLGKQYAAKVDREGFFSWLEQHYRQVEFIFHLGARTNTAEFDKSVFNILNLEYSKKVWLACADYSIPLIYASSAATYGMGEHGYQDDHRLISKLKPLNPYGESKHEFDKWMLDQTKKPPFWAGLKFFNVYGPNEYHKKRMASVIFHAFHQISQTGKMKLFKSHKAGIPDGGQKRDFIYVKDVVSIIMYLYNKRPEPGIYNVGTGKARTFLELVTATFRAMAKTPEIVFIDTPEDIRDKYQYFTEAPLEKLLSTGYPAEFCSLEDGIADYIPNYLAGMKYN
jgi:ADP-L-glycero-D-manno-heptose 6-epimerase